MSRGHIPDQPPYLAAGAKLGAASLPYAARLPDYRY